METKNVILELRTKRGLSQDELAEKIMVTRQAVSRWENGETVPNTDTLKLLSKVFDVSINTLLGQPRRLICQCCGMPLEDEIIGHDRDGEMNESYCKWCYKDIDEKSKDKDQPLMRLTRLLIMAELEMAEQIFDCKKDLKNLLEDEGNIINATYLLVTMTGGEDKVFSKVPKNFIDLIMNNMNCYHDEYEMKFYPKMDELMNILSMYEQIFEKDWYLIPDDEQVIISKFLYSIQVFKELSISLLGLNGILSAVSTRIMFDNYWQSLYLIKHNEVEKYREFVHKRMRLHILKRDDGTDVNINELLREVDDGYFDPIPVNGDYFTKSAREYAIELGIKEDYDKFYEFNSEFIHSSLTAVYSGIMVPCRNPEHNGHLTIKNGGARLVESVPGIIYILNKHIDLVNTYLNEEVLPKLSVETYFQTRSEWFDYMKERQQL